MRQMILSDCYTAASLHTIFQQIKYVFSSFLGFCYIIDANLYQLAMAHFDQQNFPKQFDISAYLNESNHSFSQNYQANKNKFMDHCRPESLLVETYQEIPLPQKPQNNQTLQQSFLRGLPSYSKNEEKINQNLRKTGNFNYSPKTTSNRSINIMEALGLSQISKNNEVNEGNDGKLRKDEKDGIDGKGGIDEKNRKHINEMQQIVGENQKSIVEEIGSQNYIKEALVSENSYIRYRNQILQKQVIRLQRQLQRTNQRSSNLSQISIDHHNKNFPSNQNYEENIRKCCAFIRNLEDQLQYLYNVNTRLLQKLKFVANHLRISTKAIRKLGDQNKQFKDEIQQQLQYNNRNIKKIIELQNMLENQQSSTISHNWKETQINSKDYNATLLQIEVKRLREKNQRYRLKVDRIKRQKQELLIEVEKYQGNRKAGHEKMRKAKC